MKPKLWRTKEGRVLEITKMTDSHLANAIAYLERRTGLGINSVQNVRSVAVLREEQKRRAALVAPTPGRRRIRLED